MADVKTLIPAGGTVTLRRVGDFVFCKFSDRELILDIKDGEGNSDGPVRVKNGSMRRPPGGVSEIEVTNPDQNNPCAAVFFIGKGDFDDKIIQGEVTITPGIRSADGSWLEDTRNTITLASNIIKPLDAVPEYSSISTAEVPDWGPGAVRLGVFDDGRILINEHTYGGDWKMFAPDFLNEGKLVEIALPGHFANSLVDTGSIKNKHPGTQVGGLWYMPQTSEGDGVVTLRAYNAWTLYRVPSADIVTDGLYTAGERIDAIVWDEQLKQWYMLTTGYDSGNGRISIMRWSGDLLWGGEIDTLMAEYPADIGGMKRGVALMDDGQIVAAGGSKTWLFQPTEGGLSYVPGSYSGAARLSPAAYCLAKSPKGSLLVGEAGQTIEERAYKEINWSFKGSSAACRDSAVFKRQKVITSADVQLLQMGNGKWVVSGEVVRAVLDLHAGMAGIRSDYLDYIYRVQFSNQAGLTPFTVDAGGKSFQAEKIHDSFTCEFPLTLNITYRRGLF